MKSQRSSGNGSQLAIAAGLVAVLGVGGYLLFFATPEAPPPAPPAADPATIDQSRASVPGAATDAVQGADADAPESAPEAEAPGIPVTAPVAELPVLTESDASIRPELLALLGDTAMTRWLEQEQLIQRITAQVAGLRRGAFSYTALLLEPPPGEFLVDRRDGRIYPSPRNYVRYDAPVSFIEGVDVAAVAEIFHRYRPLFEAAYGELGQPPEQFGDAVLGAIDHLLAAPEPAAPPELIAQSVAYVYIEEALEGESDARKQLVRMGPAHTRTVKDKLRALRSALLAPPGAGPPGAAAPE